MRPISTEIRLSLRSLSSFLLSFSALSRDFSASLAARCASLCASLSERADSFSLSECKLLRDADPRSRDGRPKLSIDFFALAEPGVAGDDRLESVGGDMVDLTRRRALVLGGGDADLGAAPGGTCIDWDDERRKKGMDDGVSRLDEPRWSEDDGLSGPWLGARPVLSAWFVLWLDAVSGRLGAVCSGVDVVRAAWTNELEGESRVEPTEESEASDAADAIAAGCTQPSLTEYCDAPDDLGCSSADFVGKLFDRGLVTTGDRLLAALRGEESFMLRLSALLMLHFLDGVRGANGVAWLLELSCVLTLCAGGEETFVFPFDGDENTGAWRSIETVRSGSLSSPLLADVGNVSVDAECGGERRLLRFFGSGGTGGTCSVS